MARWKLNGKERGSHTDRESINRYIKAKKWRKGGEKMVNEKISEVYSSHKLPGFLKIFCLFFFGSVRFPKMKFSTLTMRTINKIHVDIKSTQPH